MKHNGMRNLTVGIVMAFAVACRGVEPEPAPQHSHTLFPSLAAMDGVRPGPGRTRIDLGPVDPKLMIRATAGGPVASYDLRVEPEDSLELFARWTGHALPDLLRWNPGTKGQSLTPGEVFHMELSPDEAARFGGARMAYLATRRSHRENGVEVLSTLKHEVAEGEGLKDILNKYSTDLDTLEKMNPGLTLTGVYPGRILTIPIVAGGAKPAVAAQEIDLRLAPALPARPMEVYQVQPGDTVWALTNGKLNVSLDELRMANPGIDLAKIHPGNRLMVPKPVEPPPEISPEAVVAPTTP